VTLLIAGVTASLFMAMAGAWVVQRITRDCGWVDVVWSFAIGTAGMVYALAPIDGAAPTPRAFLAATLVGLWALRLGGHLAARTAGAPHEDARYAAFRVQWGALFDAKLFGFLQIQALAAALLALSVLVAARNPAPELGVFDFAGAALIAVAIFGEGVSDRQLRRFKSYPPNRGAICDVGLWSWSRHPNYFFEWLGWLAWPIIAFDRTGAWPWGWLALTGPALMFWLLRFASGVPPTEAAMARSRGAAFARYQARVSAFFPLPPKPAPGPADEKGTGGALA